MIRRSTDLEQLGIPVIEISPSSRDDGRKLYEDLAKDVGVSDFRPRGRSIVITSLDEAGSSAAADVAEAIAASARVILVEADLRGVTSTGSGRATGFAGMLLNLTGVPRGLRDTGNGVKVLPAGFAPGVAKAPLMLHGLPVVISQLRDRTDYVVLAAPPVFTSPDLLSGLVQLADSTLLVLEANRSKKSSVERAVTFLHEARELKLVLRRGRRASRDRPASPPRPDELRPESADVVKGKRSVVSRRLVVSPVMDFDAVLALAHLLGRRPEIHSVSLADFREDEGEAVFLLRQERFLVDDELLDWLRDATNDSSIRDKFPDPNRIRFTSG